MAELRVVGDTGGSRKSVFVVTPTVEAVWSLLDRCAARGQLGLVLGSPGVGKSAALAAYAGRNPGTVCVRASRAGATMAGFLTKLSEAVGLEWTPMRTDLVYNAVVRRIRQDREDLEDVRLVAVDEANHLHDHALEVLRDVFDEAGVGVVLLGNIELQQRLNRAAKRHTSGYIPLLSRISNRMDVEAIGREDVDAVARHHGLAGPAAGFLARVARQGGYRSVGAVLDLAYALSGGEPVGLSHLREAAGMTGTAGVQP